MESYAWFKDRESGSIPDSFRPQLHLKRVSHTDRGEYFCVARNPLGTERSKPVLLNVTCKGLAVGIYTGLYIISVYLVYLTRIACGTVLEAVDTMELEF